MAAGILITVREGLEAFLVVGILLAYLRRARAFSAAPYVWGGTAAGVAVSIALALALQALAVQFEGHAAHAFEVVAATIAVPILTYMVLWMQRHAAGLRGALEARAQAALGSGQILALAALAFITVLREGLETAVFLAALPPGASGLLSGAGVGLVLAAAIAAALFLGALRLNLRRFFVVTGYLLILIAAGLCAHIFMALHELGMPAVIEQVWSTKWLLDSESLAGRVLHAFMGYHDEPSLLQVLAYFGYLGFVGRAFHRAVRESRDRTASVPAAGPSTGPAAAEALHRRQAV